MSGGLLAVFSAPRVDEDGVEFLRALAALVAVGRTFPFLTLGPGGAALSADDLLPQAERYLDSLAEFGVRPVAADERSLREALASSPSILRCGDPARTGRPAFLEAGPAAAESELLHAGQVLAQRPRSSTAPTV